MIQELILGLDSRSLHIRLSALDSLRELELNGKLRLTQKIGPVLPNYYHIHTTASYGFGIPGVYSVAHMIWAAHEARVCNTLLIEHESISHMDEACAAAAIVNRGELHPLRLIFGVEFKAPIARDDAESRRFSRDIGEKWGQNEAAWVVGVGVRPNAELTRLVAHFQEAKRAKAVQQVAKLSLHLGFSSPPDLPCLLGPDCNVTDRSLSFALAQMKWPHVDERTMGKNASLIRKLLNPGGPGFVPFPEGLPSYQQLIEKLIPMNAIPTFTAQLRGKALEENMPVLKRWGIGGLDVAGIEPDEPDAEKHIGQFIELAKQHEMLIFGGADYRGFGTGWLKHSPWMDHPLISTSVTQLVCPQR